MVKLILPTREGPKPETGLQPPQLQYSDTSPKELVDALKAWAFAAFEFAREEPTRISVPSARALWLDETIPVHQEAFMPPAGTREFTHFHEDGSSHMVLSDEDEQIVMEAKWGIPHVYRDRGVREMLIFAPRTPEEVETIKLIVEASYRFAMSAYTRAAQAG